MRLMILKIGSRSKKTGFTLLETIIVLAVMTMFFAISIPLFSRFMETAKLDTTARSVSSALRTARGYAIANYANYYVFFDPTTTPNTYFISSQEDGDPSTVEDKIYKLPTGIWFYRIGGGTAIGFTGGVTHPDYPTVSAACFKSTGELDETVTSVSLYLADGNAANPPQFEKIITVERTTGRVKIE